MENFRTELGYLNVGQKWDLRKTVNRKLVVRALNDAASSDNGKAIQDEVLISSPKKQNVVKKKWRNSIVKLQETIVSLPSFNFLVMFVYPFCLHFPLGSYEVLPQFLALILLQTVVDNMLIFVKLT